MKKQHKPRPEHHEAESGLSSAGKALLESSKSELARFFHLSPVGYSLTVRETGQYLEVNDAFCRITGYARGQVLGKTVVDLKLFRDTPQRNAYLDLVEQTGDVRDYEHTFPDSSGQLKTCLLFAEKIDFQGRPCLVSALLDITARKKAEQDLRQSEEDYRNIFENMQDVYYRSDREGRLVAVSPSGVKLLGYRNAFEVLGRDIVEVFFNDSEQSQYVMELLKNRGAVRNFEIDLKAVDGTVITVEANGRVLRDDTGRAVGIDGIFRDVTARKKAEQALAASEEQYRGIFENMLDGYYRADMQGRIELISPSGAHMLGYGGPEAMIGLSIADNLYAEPEQQKVLLRQLFAEGRVRGFVTKLRRADGGTFVGEANSRLIHGPDGEPIGVDGVFRDITDRVESARERELLENRLRQAQKMEAVGTLAGGMAHDFNNILQVVNGYVQLMAGRELEPERLDSYLKSMESAVDRGAGLVKRMLTFARRVEPCLAPMDLNAQVRQTLALLSGSLPRMINITTRLAPDLRLVTGDAAQVEQVLVNLASNAKDAMPEGGDLTISTANLALDRDFCRKHGDAAPGDYARLSVADTGTGMEQETLGRLFEPFYTNKPTGEGTGLGLAMVYGIVKAHGGAVECESSPGQGTVFHIYLPALKTCAIPKPGEEARREPPGPGGGTVLLVDDEPSVLEVAGELLSESGYRVLTAETGEEALRIYREQGQCIDLVVLDLNMPGMGGSAALAALKKINPGVKALIASGYNAPGAERLALSRMARGFLDKPYRINDLLKSISLAIAD